jgi:hypothetical protein
VVDELPTPDTLDWLLAPANPSARYLALTKLLGRPDDDPEARSVRASIPRADPARSILRAQYPQGYWMHPGIGYSPRYRATVWQVLFLAQLGMARTEALDRAVAHLCEVNQRADGAFRASKEPGDAPLCLNGSLLWALETLGYGDTPEVARAWAWLAEEINRGGFEDRCLWAAVKVLWAVNAVADGQRTATLDPVREAAAASLLAHPPDPAHDDPRWFGLTFPLAHAADLLQWLSVLTGAGHADDPRLACAREWLERKRLPEGTWPLERSPGKLWANVGPVGGPNKWVTIRALAVGC